MTSPTFFRKSIAFLLDILVLYTFILPGFNGILRKLMPVSGISDAISLYGNMGSDQALVTTITALILLMSLYILMYFSLSEYLLGASLGMLILKMGVIDSSKNNPRLFSCIVRNLYSIPLFPFMILWIVDPLFLLLRKGDQRLTEFLTKTKVIYIG